MSVHVASVWYTHSGPLLRELQSCLTEFKQYLANLARSIRAAAADMAIGLVHPRSAARKRQVSALTNETRIQIFVCYIEPYCCIHRLCNGNNVLERVRA